MNRSAVDMLERSHRRLEERLSQLVSALSGPIGDEERDVITDVARFLSRSAKNCAAEPAIDSRSAMSVRSTSTEPVGDAALIFASAAAALSEPEIGGNAVKFVWATGRHSYIQILSSPIGVGVAIGIGIEKERLNHHRSCT